MGKSIAFRYSVQLILAPGSGYAMTPAGWRERKQGQIPGDGKPTNANLKKIRRQLQRQSGAGQAKRASWRVEQGSRRLHCRSSRGQDDRALRIRRHDSEPLPVGG